MHIIAIDVGTSNCKAVVVDSKTKVLTSFQSPTKPIQPRPGWNEQDAEAIFKAVLQLLQQAIAFSKPENVACISFSAAMHSLLAVDDAGKPLMNMLTWADLRSAPYAKALKRKPIAKRLYETTGVPIHAMSPLCKIVWLRHEAPHIFAKAHKFISIKEYIFSRLFGRYVVDHSIAAASGLLDAQRINWSATALKTAGITAGQLSQLCPVDHYEAALLPAIKKRLQLAATVPFVLGGSDGAMANLGSGIVTSGNAAITVGTSGAVRVTTAKYVCDNRQRLFSYYIGEGLYITGGAINNGGITLQWLVENIFKDDFKDEKKLNRLVAGAAKLEPGAEALIFLPYILGERAPVWDEDAKGCFIGLTTRHTNLHLTRAVLEGVCYAVTEVLQALEETNGRVKSIYLSGGIIRSPQWVQLLADVCGKQIHVNDDADASALGAAFVGMRALGQVKSLKKAKMFLGNVETFTPNKVNHRVYKKYLEIYNRLYHDLRTSFDHLTLQLL